MKELYKSVIQESLNVRCEVYSTDNHLLFLGEITDYSDKNDEIRLENYRGKEIPWNILSVDMTIRVFVYTKSGRSFIHIVEGNIALLMRTYLLLEVKSILSKGEGRKNFRQGVNSYAKVALSYNPANEQICRVIDVSLTGCALAVKDQEEYEVGEEITVSDMQLRKGSVSHCFQCEIVRKKPLESGEIFYGCKFQHISVKAEDKLIQDIFALQAEDLNR